MAYNPHFAVYTDLLEAGDIVSPRGQEILELEDYQFHMNPLTNRFTSFRTRKLNLDYMKKEFAWYVRADRYETSIADSAQIWNDLIDEDGGINSNYGQYLFARGGTTQFEYVIDTLSHDKDSRRAVMVLLNQRHLTLDQKDVVCTYSISFRIRDDALNMSINMRSWDAVWGMTNDVFCFSCIYEMVYRVLQRIYPQLKVGSYCHKADSLHVYARHFKMLETIVKNGLESEYYELTCPEMSFVEAIMFSKNMLDARFPFGKWLLEVDNETT